MTHGSLFSGIGGFDIAAEWAGFDNLFHCEWNPFCQKVLSYHFPKAIQHHDINKTDFTVYRGRVDILTGGFPCQGFSVAGLRLGTEDDRYLWPQYLRAIDEIQPTYVIGENVTGILSMEDKSGIYRDVFAKVDHRKITRFPEIDYYEAVYTRQAKLLVGSICESLEERGYEVQTFAIPAAGVGAPHKRERIWFIAHHASHTKHDGCDAAKGRGNDSQSSVTSGKNKVGQSEGTNSIQSGNIANTNCNDAGRCRHGETGCETREVQGKQKERQRVRYKSERVSGEGDATNADEPGLQKPRRKSRVQKTDEEFRTEFFSGEIISDTDKLNGNLSGFRTGETSQQQEAEVFGGNATNPDNQHGRCESQFGSSNGSGSRDKSERENTIHDEHAVSTGCEEQHFTGITTESRFSCGRHITNWDNWPTQPPVCSGDDGLSAGLDGVTFSSWRNESHKSSWECFGAAYTIRNF